VKVTKKADFGFSWIWSWDRRTDTLRDPRDSAEIKEGDSVTARI